jgi:DME family drug/metabolite transporter
VPRSAVLDPTPLVLEPIPTGSRWGRVDRTWLVALAAGTWGVDGLLREPILNAGISPETLVFAEHALAFIVLLPLLPTALRALARCSWRARLAAIGIGAGASAGATVLFTRALATGDFVTPVVLQQTQPIIAIALAMVILGERPRRLFLLFVLPALVGVWLLTFPHPLDVSLKSATPALLALAAAALWGAGTVLGRVVGAEVGAREVTTLRYAIGLPSAAIIVFATGSRFSIPLHSLGWVAGLAWLPGLIALELYYAGLRCTAASRATLAELAYPVTGAILGAAFLGAHLAAGQWAGAAVVVASVTALGLYEHRATR